jgi:protein phosphatase 2C
MTIKIKSYSITCQGPRPYMEDTYAITKLNKNVNFLGVFDGHGGAGVAEICKTSFPAILKESINWSCGDANVAIRKTFSLVDQLVEIKQQNYVGSTAAIVLLDKDNAWFANAGDSMSMIITHTGDCKLMSVEHKADSEAERIAASGGILTYADGMGRVNGTLNLSRSIGDHYLKPVVISDPFIQKISLKGVKYIVMASDGIWDVYNTNQLGKDIQTLCKRHSLERVVEMIVDKAYHKGSMDNITLIISVIEEI